MSVDELCTIKISGPYTAKDKRITNQTGANKARCTFYLNDSCQSISAVVILILVWYIAVLVTNENKPNQFLRKTDKT